MSVQAPILRLHIGNGTVYLEPRPTDVILF
jgi:hypothetical protein